MLLEHHGWVLHGSFYFKNDQELRLTMTIPSDTPNSAREAALAKSELLAAGIDLVVKVVPEAQFFPDAAWVPLYPKPQATAVTSGLVNIGPFGFGTPDWSDIGLAS